MPFPTAMVERSFCLGMAINPLFCFRNTHTRIHAEPLALADHYAVRARDSEFQTFSHPARAIDEVVGGFRRAQIAGRRLEQREPAVEMTGLDRERQMLLHR